MQNPALEQLVILKNRDKNSLADAEKWLADATKQYNSEKAQLEATIDRFKIQIATWDELIEKVKNAGS